MTGYRELTALTAVDAVEKLRRREVSPVEMVKAVLQRIDETDGKVNAIPTVCAEMALSRARSLTDSPPDKGDPFWQLAGLPIAVKDLVEVKGVRTTYGSPLFKDFVPNHSNYLVETLENRGAIVIGKSNTPEFGAGGNTFNEVFGATRNPWNLKKTVGGSSGGSAGALAAQQVHLATGSDMGGSLRMPASFCSVVGLRPSPGRVANGPTDFPFANLSVQGPMGRNVADTALMLDSMKGMHRADPISLPAVEEYLVALERYPVPRRVAWSKDLGVTPVDPEVAEICKRAALRFQELGAVVEEASPDFTNARQVFHIMRAAAMVAKFAAAVEQKRDAFKPELIWNVEEGLNFTSRDIGWADAERGKLYARIAKFYDTYDLLLCPTTVVEPFDVETRYVTEVAGTKFDNYIDWFTITYVLTLTSLPVLSLPCGFTRSGLPIGLQIAGRPRGEAELLSHAHKLESLLGIRDRVPVIE
jgi:amidase